MSAEKCAVELKLLLKGWKSEKLYETFKEEDIFIEELEMMTAEHLEFLLRNYKMGLRIRFEYHFKKWRTARAKPLGDGSKEHGKCCQPHQHDDKELKKSNKMFEKETQTEIINKEIATTQYDEADHEQIQQVLNISPKNSTNSVQVSVSPTTSSGNVEIASQLALEQPSTTTSPEAMKLRNHSKEPRTAFQKPRFKQPKQKSKTTKKNKTNDTSYFKMQVNNLLSKQLKKNLTEKRPIKVLPARELPSTSSLKEKLATMTNLNSRKPLPTDIIQHQQKQQQAIGCTSRRDQQQQQQQVGATPKPIIPKASLKRRTSIPCPIQPEHYQTDNCTIFKKCLQTKKSISTLSTTSEATAAAAPAPIILSDTESDAENENSLDNVSNSIVINEIEGLAMILNFNEVKNEYLSE